MEIEKNDDVEETLDLPEVKEGEEDTTDWKAEAQKLREKAIRQRERTKELKKRATDAEAKMVELAKGVEPNAPKSDLDENALDYLDLKGITESEDVDIVRNVVKRTGVTVREALKDEYVKSKLEANKKAREVKDAVPSSSRRSGGGDTNSLELAIAAYEQSGYTKLPDDFDLRSKVVNAVAARTSRNSPPWRR